MQASSATAGVDHTAGWMARERSTHKPKSRAVARRAQHTAHPSTPASSPCSLQNPFQQQETGAMLSAGQLRAPYLHPQPSLPGRNKACGPTGLNLRLLPRNAVIGPGSQSSGAKELLLREEEKDQETKGAHFNPAETPALLYKQRMGSPEPTLPKQRL